MKNWLRNIFAKQNLFIGSVLFGALVWCFSFLLLPIETSQLSNETLGYLMSCFTLFIVGYYAFNFKNQLRFFDTRLNKNYFKICVVILVIAITFRYIDLFYYRLLSFNFSFIENKKLVIQNATQAPLIVTLISTLRAMYFLPLLYLVIRKSKNKTYWSLSILLILLSSSEILLVGTRKPLFHLVLLLLFTSLYSYNIKDLLTKQNFFLGGILVVLLGVFSYSVLSRRMIENTGSNLGILKVIDSRYNDFVKINKDKVNELYGNPSSKILKTELLLIHTGQYIVHGVYELNYIIQNDFPKANGLYSFNPIYKFFNRIKVIDVDNSQLKKSHPRDYVYLTFFGSLFVDFGWLSLLLVFLFGVFQRFIFQISDLNIIAKLLWIVILTLNIAIPIFNLAAGSGLYVLLCLNLLLFLSLMSPKLSK